MIRYLLMGAGILLGLSSCLLGDDDDDCMSPRNGARLDLISDCSGTYCETNADCPSDRICMRKGPPYSPAPNVPIGCILKSEMGEAGSPP